MPSAGWRIGTPFVRHSFSDGGTPGIQARCPPKLFSTAEASAKEVATTECFYANACNNAVSTVN